jgi:hypothetical protein
MAKTEKQAYIKVYVSEETKKKAVEKYGKMCVSYAVNKIIQKDLKENK